MACPADSVLVQLCQGVLAPSLLADVETHLDTCETCCALILDLAANYSKDRSVTNRDAWESAPSEEPGDAAAEHPVVGQRYVILAKIGQGGMGQVFRALDRLTGQIVALKRVFLSPATRPSRVGESRSVSGARTVITYSTLHAGMHTPRDVRRQALTQEFRTLATLRHPNIISVLDYGFDSQRHPFFTMELLEGSRPILPAMANAPRVLKINLLLQLLQALSYLHHRRTLHGDIKPSNVLVVDTPHGAVARLLDFGLASSEGDLPIERLAGTPAYMAKERFSGAAHSASADLYAVGVLAFELLTGQHPFCDESAPEKLISAVLRDAPRLTLLPEALRPLFARVLSAHPGQRPHSASAFAHELALATSHPIRGEPEAVRDSWLVAAKFTGRQQELSELKHALDQSLRGQGGAWLVRGESGAGKSRLLEELRSAALVEGVLVARGQAAESSGTAFHLFHDVLRIVALHVQLDRTEASVLGTILPDLGKLLERPIPSPPELDAPANRLRLLATVRSVIERVPAPLLMLLEDVQWADDESLSLLAQIAAGLKQLPLLLVATYRDDEAPHPPSQLSHLRVQQLKRLDRSGIAQLLESLLGPPSQDTKLIDLLVRETEGNTFFIVESVRALAEEAGALGLIGRGGVPERVFSGGVAKVVERRLGRAPHAARPFLQRAAVAGRQLDLSLLHEPGEDTQALALACAEAGILEVYEQAWRFSHDKLRERLLADLTNTQRNALHLGLAWRIIAAHPEDPVRAGRAAYHFREAGEWAKAEANFTRAAESALRRGASAEAEALFGHAQALQRLISVSRLQRVRVLRGLSEARFAQGKLREADLSLRATCEAAALPLPETALDWPMAFMKRSWSRLVSRPALRSSWLLPVLPQDVSALRREILAALSVQETYVWLARPDLAFFCTLWGIELELDFSSPALSTLSGFRIALVFLLSYTPLRDMGLRFLNQAAQQNPPSGLLAVDLLRVAAMVNLNAGRLPAAVEAAQQAVTQARSIKDDLATLRSLLPLQLALIANEECAAALDVSREMEALAVRTQNPHFLALSLMGQSVVWLRYGEFEKTEEMLKRTLASLPVEMGPVPESVARGLSASCALMQGQLALAEERAAQTVETIKRARWEMVELRHALGCVLEVYLEVPNFREHLPTIQWALALFRRLGRLFPLAPAQIALYEGRLLQREGRKQAALARLQSALQHAERSGLRYVQALAHYWIAQLALMAGDQVLRFDCAQEHLRAAARIFRSLGAAWELRRCQTALSGLAGFSHA